MSSLKNIAKLFSANVIAQAIGVLVYPLLTRLYLPEDFGVMNLFLTVASILVLTAVLDLHNAIPLPKENHDALSLFKFGCLSLFIVVVLIIIFTPFIGYFLPELVDVWWMMPIYIAVIGLWQLVSFYMNREKRFGGIATFQIIQSSSNSLSKIFFGYISPSGVFLVVSSLIGQLFALAIVSFKRLKYFFTELKKITFADMKENIAKYREFPLYAFPKNLLVQLSNGLPVLILSQAFDMKEIGYFSLAITIGFLPIQMIANSIYQVLLQQVSEKVNNGERICAPILRFIKYSAAISIPLFSALYFILPFLTEFMFGDGWERTGEVLRLLLPWCLATFFLSSLVFIPEVLLKLKANLWIEIANIILRVAVIYIGVYSGDFLFTMFLIGISTFIVRLIQLLWFVHLTKSHDRELEN